MKQTGVIFPAIAMLIGVLIGWLISHDGFGNARGADSVQGGDHSSSGRDMPHHSDRRGSRESRNTADKEAQDADHLKVDPADLHELLKTEVEPLERRGQFIKLDEPLAKLLDVTLEEAQVINSLWGELSGRLKSERIKNTRSQRFEDGSMWLGVSPFPVEGERIRRQILLTVIETLGESRGKVLLDAISAHGAYGQWGKTVGSGFSIRVKVEENGGNLYVISEQESSEGSAGKTWQCAQIPAHLEDLARAAGIQLKL
jgi:hypothetical protein